MVKSYFRGIRKILLSELESATEKIVVAVYWFTNHELFKKINEKLEKGVQVEIIIHNDYINNRDNGLNFQEFIDKGGEFYFSDMSTPMHNKFCVIDNKVLINGSYNWTYYAEDRNSENILLIKEEKDVINSFVEEFEKLKLQMEKVSTISKLTISEVDENNLLNTRDYLANDIVFQSATIGDINIIEEAFLLAPNNIEVQKNAYNLNLINKYILRHSIGTYMYPDKYTIIVPKGSFIPFSNNIKVQTVFNNQTSCLSKSYYGEDVTNASSNTHIASIIIDGLPPKPAGEAKMRYHLTIDINGKLLFEISSIDNGKKQFFKKDISNLLIPNAFSEILISTIEDINVNITRYVRMSPNYYKEKIEELKMMIIKQINQIENLCTSLDQANVLLSLKKRDLEYSLTGIRKKYIHYLNHKYLDIDNALLELHNNLYKKFFS